MSWRPVVQPRAALAGLVLLSLCLLAGSVSLGLIESFHAPASMASQSVDLARLSPGDSQPSTDWFESHPDGQELVLRTIGAMATTLATVGVIVPLAAVVGVFGGLSLGYASGSGYVRNAKALGSLASAVMRTPNLIVAVVAAWVVGPGALTVPLVVAVVLAASFAEAVQPYVRAAASQEFMNSARYAGATHGYLMRTVLPVAVLRALGHVRVALATGLGIQAVLSLLAFGSQRRAVSLGTMLGQSLPQGVATPEEWLLPAVALALVLLSASVLAWPNGRSASSEVRSGTAWSVSSVTRRRQAGL